MHRNLPPDRNARSSLLRDAETALFELILAEPTGSKRVRTHMLTACRDLIRQMRNHLRLTQTP